MPANFGDLAIDLGFMIGLPALSGDPFAEIKSHFQLGSAFTPTKINLKNGLGQNQLYKFKNIVNRHPFLKVGNIGDKFMNTRYIINKFKEKQAAIKMGGPAISLHPVKLFLNEIAKPALQTAMYGLGAGLLGNVVYNQYKDYSQSKNAYKEMFERFPELKEVDRKKIDDYWTIMDQYAPSMTLNPLVAGQFIKNMVDYNMQGIDFPTLKSIMDIQHLKDKGLTDNLRAITSAAGQAIL